MLAIIGDIHQHFDELHHIVDGLPAHVTHVLQVGDLFVRPDAEVPGHLHWRTPRRPVHYIDGNHHYFPDTRGLRTMTEVRPGLIFCPRGLVQRLGDYTVGFLGGADTVTGQDDRTSEYDWWPNEERVTEADLRAWETMAPGTVDLLITHTPPASVTTAMTGDPPHPSAQAVQAIWEHLGRPEVVSGHMHRSYKAPGVEVLPFLGLTYRP